MKKKEKIPQKFKDFVNKSCQECAWNIGVSHYKIDIHYMDEPKESESDNIIRGTMETDRRYLKGTLRLYPIVLEFWEEGKIEQVREVIYHEISHLATQHCFDLMTATYKDECETKDAWETLTEVVARMSLRIRELEIK